MNKNQRDSTEYVNTCILGIFACTVFVFTWVNTLSFQVFNIGGMWQKLKPPMPLGLFPMAPCSALSINKHSGAFPSQLTSRNLP